LLVAGWVYLPFGGLFNSYERRLAFGGNRKALGTWCRGFVVGNILADGDYFTFVAFPSMTLAHGPPSVELSNVYV
jgi:hypothetical protein